MIGKPRTKESLALQVLSGEAVSNFRQAHGDEKALSMLLEKMGIPGGFIVENLPNSVKVTVPDLRYCEVTESGGEFNITGNMSLACGGSDRAEAFNNLVNIMVKRRAVVHNAIPALATPNSNEPYALFCIK